MPSYPSLPFEFPFGEPVKQWQTIRTEFESGHIQTRQKTTTAPRLYGPNAHRSLSSADVTTWLSFWDSVAGEAGSFQLTDPRTAVVYTVRFKGQPSIKRTGPQTWDIEPVVFEEAL